MPKILNYELQCMKHSLFILLFIGLLSCSDKKNNVERLQKTPPQESSIQPKNTDEQQEILTMKPYKTLEDDILILKNVALCNCLGQEYARIKKQNPHTYTWIPDGTLGGYVQCSNLDLEWIVANPTLDKLVSQWLDKPYYNMYQRNAPQKAYPTYMKCLDFYNSEGLKEYLDSVRKELKERYADNQQYIAPDTKTAPATYYKKPLLQKKHKTVEDKWLLLKNIAFCDCMEYEAEQISQQAPDQYHLAFDNSIAAYSSALDSSLTKEIPALTRLVEKWHQKPYEARPLEEDTAKNYLIIMKCIDFYNSKTLEKHIDSLKQLTINN